MTRSPRTPLRLLALAALCAGLAGCNVIDIVLGRDAKLSGMVPGGNIATGGLDCWLTFEFDRYPESVDLTDIRVRFRSVALERDAEFDWRYIAGHDFLAGSRGSAFGSGHTRAKQTTPENPPPLGQGFKARFPLQARAVVENAPSTITLEAELYWGGKKQDSMTRTVEHVYGSKPGSFL